jgi:hypothetical protein
MARFIAFDSGMANHLRNLHDSVIVKTGSALEAALADPSDSIVVLPGETPETVILVRVHRNKALPHERFEATGFLGLTDEPVYDDDPQPDMKKSWWKKVF